ncbi:TrmH family RNA methyltransferase [Actinomyces gaoshouyii]|uniref:RNA methyltransferase n=1 Tax=Actinomyces gaoshouyii TaxID=1960083 RepID=A0A8H9LM68_9ACTO|nr:RNA methyltransferase [Actinomyces gaoshouyii]GGP00043.1 RNA methyltransferase [Actinomyces gaoshouyii]
MSRRGDDSISRPDTSSGSTSRERSGRDGILANPTATRVARIAGLARRQARSKHRRFLVEGPQGVREAVRWAPERVLDLYMTEAAASRHPEIWAEAKAAGLYRHLTTAEVMAAMSADAQGVLAVAAMGESNGADTLTGALEGTRLVAVLTGAQDPGNAGTIIRAADAAGADAVILLRGSVEATSPKVVRSTAGSLFHLPVITGVGLEEAVKALRAAGLTILVADSRGETDLFEAEASVACGGLLSAPSAWLLGNEAHGFAPEVLNRADAVISIPILGRAESLNVATAAALCLYASARAQRA